jgi:ubiquinone/menaquinone biosynthesis C-methylase UbiE
MKIILDLCGGTGAWSLPYKEAGYDVRNITLPDYDVMTYIPPDNV